jgi:hypothetical protein
MCLKGVTGISAIGTVCNCFGAFGYSLTGIWSVGDGGGGGGLGRASEDETFGFSFYSK